MTLLIPSGHVFSNHSSNAKFDMSVYNGSRIHCTWVVSGTNFKLYVNAVQQVNATITAQTFGSTRWQHMDAARYTNPDIRIYDTSIWSGAMSPADVTAMYNAERNY